MPQSQHVGRCQDGCWRQSNGSEVGDRLAEREEEEDAEEAEKVSFD